MKKIKQLLFRLNPFKVSLEAEALAEFPNADAVHSISGVDHADIDFKRIEHTLEMDESEVRSEYENWTKEIAKRNLRFIREKTAHEKYNLQEEIEVWHICTQKFTYPAMKKMLDTHYPQRTFTNGVDLGCGTVTFFDWVEVQNATLVDLSEDYCSFMADKGWTVLNENVENLSIESGSQDIVVCSDILEHVLSFEDAMAEIKRIITPDGLLLVNVPWEQELAGIPAMLGSHIRTFNEENLDQKFGDWDIMAREVIGPTVEPNGIKTINLLFTQRNAR